MTTTHTMCVAAGLLLACVNAQAQPSPQPAAVLDSYIAAVHAGDMAAVRALIAPEVERSDFPGCTPSMDNPSCLAHYIDATVVRPQARLSLLSTEVDGDRVSALLEVRSELYRRAGVERIVGRDVLRVTDGQIRSFRFVPDFSDAPTAVFFGTLGIGPRASQAPAK
jgi:hypothetical protein